MPGKNILNSQHPQSQSQPFPIKVDWYLHDHKFGETDDFAELLDQGYCEEDLPRYIVYELPITVEIHKGGEVHITHVDGQQLDKPIINK